MTTFEVLLVGGVTILCFAIVTFILHLVRSLLHFRALDLCWIGILAVSLFGVTFFSPVDYSEFDALGNLLTSQRLLTQGTTHLDEYIPPFTGIMGWHLREKQGYRYYHYPLGTPIYAIPLVWLANTSGFDMAHRHTEVMTALYRIFSQRFPSRWLTFLCISCVGSIHQKTPVFF